MPGMMIVNHCQMRKALVCIGELSVNTVYMLSLSVMSGIVYHKSDSVNDKNCGGIYLPKSTVICQYTKNLIQSKFLYK